MSNKQTQEPKSRIAMGDIEWMARESEIIAESEANRLGFDHGDRASRLLICAGAWAAFRSLIPVKPTNQKTKTKGKRK